MNIERISLPGGAYVETNRNEPGFYWLTLPNGATVYAGVRSDPAFPEIVGATYVTLTTMDAPAANHSDGDPRAQVCLNDATLYDNEEARR